MLDLFDIVVVDWISLNVKGDRLDKLNWYLSVEDVSECFKWRGYSLLIL